MINYPSHASVQPSGFNFGEAAQITSLRAPRVIATGEHG